MTIDMKSGSDVMDGRNPRNFRKYRASFRPDYSSVEAMKKREMSKADRYLTKAYTGLCLTGLLYFSALFGTQVFLDSRSPRIETQTRLEQVLDVERDKINPSSDAKIRIKFVNHNDASSEQLKDGSYLIRIGGSMANETSVAHEAYRVLSGDCDNLRNNSGLENGLKYLFWSEPRATFHEVFREK